MSVLTYIREALAKTKFPKLKNQTAQGGLKWVCCNDAFKSTTRKGSKPVWMVWCMWKKQGKTGGMNRVAKKATTDAKTGTVSLGPRPPHIEINGKTMPRCAK